MYPNTFTLFDAISAFSALMLVWLFGIVWLLFMILNLIFGRDCWHIIDDSTFLVVCIVIFIMLLIIPYSILLNKSRCFKLLLSMHRLYKDDPPYYALENLLKSFVLLFIDVIIYSLINDGILATPLF